MEAFWSCLLYTSTAEIDNVEYFSVYSDLLISITFTHSCLWQCHLDIKMTIGKFTDSMKGVEKIILKLILGISQRLLRHDILYLVVD